jgi:putative endonuclease
MKITNRKLSRVYNWTMSFFVYILRTSSDTLYIGQTNDLEKRIKEHKSKSARSSKYVRYFSSVELVYHETYKIRGEAMKREVQLKKLSRSEKEALIKGDLNILK